MMAVPVNPASVPAAPCTKPRPARRRSPGPRSATQRAPQRAPRPVKIILADDHAGIRRSLRLLLDQEAGVEVVAEAAELACAERQVRRHHPHVLVLDLGMRNGSSVETIRRLREQAPVTQIVVLTMTISPAFAKLALDAGARGFVLKDRADSELPAAVREVAAGREYVSPQVADGLETLRRR